MMNGINRLKNIVKQIIPMGNDSLEQLQPIVIKTATDYIVPMLTTPMLATPILTTHTPIHNVSNQNNKYEFIDEEEYISKPKLLPVKITKNNKVSPKYDFIDEEDSPVIVKEHFKILKKPETVKKDICIIPDVTNILQQLLSLSKPELTLMNPTQWGAYLHEYITQEYVYIGQTKSTPFYRKRKQLMEDLEALEKNKASKLSHKDTLILNYIAWRLDINIIFPDMSDNKIYAFPDMHTWRRETQIIVLYKEKATQLESSLMTFIDSWELAGGDVEWPSIDGKKDELISLLGNDDDLYKKMKKDTLSKLVGKKVCMSLVSSWALTK